MAIRTKGNPIAFEETNYKSDDHNDTVQYLERFGINIAELSFRVLQSGGFTNAPNLVVDEMTTASGVKGTINTGTSNSVYRTDTDDYALFGLTGNESSVPTSNNSATNINILTNTGTIDSSSGFISKVSFSTSSSGNSTYTVDIKKGSTIIASNTVILSSTYIGGAIFTRSDYSELLESGDTYSIVISKVSGISLSIESATYSSSNTYFSYTSQPIPYINSSGIWVEFKEYIEVSSGGTVMVDTNTTTLDGNEKGFAISLPEADIPTNTSITATISDGTNNLTETTISNISKGCVIVNDGSLNSGTLECTLTLKTTDTSVTPTINGYGINIMR